MQTRRINLFTTIRTEGGLLPADILQRIVEGYGDIEGLNPADYHLYPGEKLNEAINRSWNRLTGAWISFRNALEKLPESDTGTTETRERWLLPFFQELGYGRLQTTKAITIDGKSYPISHIWQKTPIHLVGCRLDLDRRTPGAAGAARTSPHSLGQEFLNRSNEHLWGFLSNGLLMRILRDNVSLTRQAYVEFDLETMMDGEVYADFAVLWLVCHQSRVESERPEQCWLERWCQHAQDRGTRALDTLRSGVEEAINALGRGFLSYPGNRALKDKLRSGMLDKQNYYRQLLRFIYRMLFLFVAEDRELLLSPEADTDAKERYARYYSTSRLRRMAERKRGTRHADLGRMIFLVFEKLGDENGCPDLGLPALGSLLWSRNAIADLTDCDISNFDLLETVRHLAFIVDKGVRRPVDYKNLGSEELGSIYESLLEMHPELGIESGTFDLKVAAGHERKSTGSYYTPSSLINCLLDSALDPVLDEAVKKEDSEQAILNLKVCDPATGSGHFLVAAAHRIARRLAAIRTGDEEPAPDAMRHALRDVIGRCVYGVDINPMAVELCKVSLWMESLEPDKPLSFLDHHIQCGNSLLGTTPALLQKGIPDDAFKPIEGDDKEFCTKYRKINRDERKGQTSLWSVREEQIPWNAHKDLFEKVDYLSNIDDTTIHGIAKKHDQYEKLIKSREYANTRLQADAWCAAFVWKKKKEPNLSYPITEEIFQKILNESDSISVWMKNEIGRLADQYQFFHWHLAFPDVFQVPQRNQKIDNEQTGWIGGFDVVLGNPPWERIKLQEKEFFAQRDEDIATAPNAAARKRLIAKLPESNPPLWKEFATAKRMSEGGSHFIRNSNMYPLSAVGDINTYQIFAGLFKILVSTNGRAGLVIPSGIATDDSNKKYFAHLVEKQSLVSLYDFENREGIFPSIHSSYKLCLLTIGGVDAAPQGADFAFSLTNVEQLRDENRHFRLSSEEIVLLNPNTKTCPIFQNKRDAEITSAIYRRIPVLIDESKGELGNPWGISFLRMFDMTNDSHLFRTREQLEADGWQLLGNVLYRNENIYLPLYEPRMINQFDHRFGTYNDIFARGTDQGQFEQPTKEDLDQAEFTVLPRFWVPKDTVFNHEVIAQLKGLIGFRAVARNTDSRTMISCILPLAGVGNNMPIITIGLNSGRQSLLFCSNLNAFVFDFVVRQKVAISLNFFAVKQLPILRPERYSPFISENITVRALELTYTSSDLAEFANDCGCTIPPFHWDEERRFKIRCELDAMYLHLYGINRDDANYIMETFPIVKRKDEQKYGEYRTKRVILEIYDEMAEAMRTGKPYQTRLDPPPADPRVAHSPREAK